MPRACFAVTVKVRDERHVCETDRVQVIHYLYTMRIHKSQAKCSRKNPLCSPLNAKGSPIYPSRVPHRQSHNLTSHLPPPQARKAKSPACNRRLLLVRDSIAISLLVALPPPRPDIPLRRTAAAQAQMDDEPENTERRPDPHEREHLRPQAGADIQARLARDDVPEDQKHDRGDDRRGRGQERGDEGPNRHGETPPARPQNDGRDEDVDEVHAQARQEKAEHEIAS